MLSANYPLLKHPTPVKYAALNGKGKAIIKLALYLPSMWATAAVAQTPLPCLMARRTAEIKTQLSQQILTLVLDYEQKEREISLAQSELNHHQLIQKTIEIDYRFGGSNTPVYLQTLQRGQEINANLLQTQASLRQTLSKLLLLTHSTETTQNAQLSE